MIDDDVLSEDFESPEEATDQLLADIKSRGAWVGYKALLEVAADPKAPPPARATAGTTLFRAAGLLARDDDRGAKLEPHQMTMPELEREIRRLERKSRKQHARDGGVFD
jgi:hypothetical protein